LKVPDMVLDAVSKLKVPYSMAIGDKDLVLSKAQVLQTEAALKQKVGEPEANNYEIRIYPVNLLKDMNVICAALLMHK
jgi:hypothetical protein